MNFIFSIVLSSVFVLILVLIPWIGVGALKLDTLFGVVIPYLALAAFFIGIIGRVIGSLSGFRRRRGSSGVCRGSSRTEWTTQRGRQAR